MKIAKNKLPEILVKQAKKVKNKKITKSHRKLSDIDISVIEAELSDAMNSPNLKQNTSFQRKIEMQYQNKISATARTQKTSPTSMMYEFENFINDKMASMEKTPHILHSIETKGSLDHVSSLDDAASSVDSLYKNQIKTMVVKGTKHGE